MDYRDDKVTESIIAAIIKVHQSLGPGFLESIYQKALRVELEQSAILYEVQKEVLVSYAGIEVGRHRLDLLVERRVIVELKVVQELSPTHYAQLRSYLRATRLRVGLLVNFFKAQAEFRRIEV